MQFDASVAERIAAGADPADEQFRLLVESVLDYAIFLIDSEGVIATWNPGAERIKGYSAADAIGRHFSMFYAPEDRAARKPQGLLARAARDGRVDDEGWRLRKDGSRFWADVVITALRSPSGALCGFAKVTRDLTDQLHTRRRLEESEALLKAFTDHSPAVMFLKDAQGRYRFVNQPFLARFGVTSDAVLGRRDDELFARAQALALSAGDAEVLASGAPTIVEDTSRQVAGERISVVVKFPVCEAAGTPTGVGAIITDITERKLAEQSLREQRTLLAEAQKVAGLGCWEWDPASGRVIWSEQLYRIYGLEPGSFEPSFEAYLERLHPDDRAQIGAVVARALLEGHGFTVEERIVRPDGGVRQLRTVGEVLRGADGRPLKLLCACFDVTEQKDSEAALRAAAQALQALTRRLVEAEEAERRRIARELHDRVGQNLSALNINLDIALATLSGASPQVAARLRESLALVDGTAQTIETVMADLRPPLLDEYGLGAALAWHAEEFSRRVGIRIAFSDEAKEAIRGLRAATAAALFRIAQEALTNVAKHAEVKSARMSLAIEEGTVVLAVSDQGHGFDAAAGRPHRWGLSTMRERAEGAGGRISIDAAPGRGTTVRASVPFT